MVKKQVSQGKVFLVVVAVLIIIFVLIVKLGSTVEIESNGNIAYILVEGVITLGASAGVPFQQQIANANVIVSNIESANENDNIKAIILEINSPGGTAVASKMIADALEKVEKPKIALIREIGTSGAYWVASATDQIIADELSITGSIGVIGSYLEFAELFEDYGVGYQRLVSGKYKDIGTPLKRLTGEEERLLQSRLDEVHEFFIKEVKKNRDIKENDEVFSGIFFLGTEAKELGLIDVFGDKETAVNLAKELAGVSKEDIVEYREERTFFDFFSSISASTGYYIGKGIGTELVSKDETFGINL